MFSSTASDVIRLLNDYLFSQLPLDIEDVHKGATSLSHLKRTLGVACQGLNRSAFVAYKYVKAGKHTSTGNATHWFYC